MKTKSIFSIKMLLTSIALISGYSSKAQQVTVPRPWLEEFPINSLYAPNGFDDDDENWVVGASAQTPGNPGDFLMTMHMSGMSAPTYFTTVNVSGIIASDSFSFDYRYFDGFSAGAPAAGSGYFKVFISSDQGVNYTQIDSISNNTIGAWFTKKYALANYVGQTLKFKIQSFWSSTNEILVGIDNMAVNGIVPCTNPPIVNLGADTTICSGESITLNAGNAGASYVWSDASTNQTLTVTGGGTYVVKVTTAPACFSLDTIVVTEMHAPSVDGITSTGISPSFTFTADNPSGGTNYTWDFGDNNSGTGSTVNHTYDANGTYIVSLTVSNDCGDVTVSDTIEVSGVYIDKLLLGELKIYPNPANDVVKLINSSAYKINELIITNILGQEVIRNKSIANSNEINISQLPEGLYNIKLIFDEGVVNRKLSVVR